MRLCAVKSPSPGDEKPAAAAIAARGATAYVLAPPARQAREKNADAGPGRSRSSRRTRRRAGRALDAGGAAVAVRRGGADLRHGHRRRGDAADRIRPVDHRMEAGDRRHSAAQRSRVAGGVRQLQADPAIRGAQPRHDARRLQGDLRLGMGPSSARAPDRPGLHSARAVVLAPRARSTARSVGRSSSRPGSSRWSRSSAGGW